MDIICITQARTGSTRLPNKVLKKIEGSTLLDIHLQRLKKCNKISQIIVATTTKDEDKKIVQIAKKQNLSYFRGAEEDVLDRFYQALRGKDCDYVVRVTSDCPLLDPVLVDKIIEYTNSKRLDYCSNTLDPTFPDGQCVEVFNFKALKQAWKEAQKLSDREHVSPYIWRNSTFNGEDLFKSENYFSKKDYSNVRMTVDEKEDFEVVKALVKHLGIDKSWLEYTDYLLNNEELRSKNNFERNEGLKKSLENDTNSDD